MRFRSVAAGLAAGALVVLGVAGPVHAEDPKYTTEVADVEVPLDPRPNERTTFDVTVKAAADATRANAPLTVVFDLTGAVGVADFAPASENLGCETAGRLVSCTPKYLKLPEAGKSVRLPFNLTGVQGGAPDGKGTVKVSVTTPDGTAIAGSSAVVSVRKAPLVRLAVVKPKWSMKVGETQPLTLGLTNSGGTRSSEGVLVHVSHMNGLAISERFSNCEYSRVGEGTMDGYPVRALCAFKGPFEPGVWYQASQPMTLTALPSAYVEFLAANLSADTPENRTRLRGKAPYEKGDGPELTLAPAPRWSEPVGSFEYTVSVDNKADFTVTGPAELVAQPGSTVPAEFVFRNEGPARIYSPWEEASAGYLHVDVPKGVTAVDGHRCRIADGADAPGEAEETTGYACYLPSTPVAMGHEEKFPFKLKIDSSVADGAVITTRIQRAYGVDAKPQNDVLTTKITFSAGPAPTGSPTASPSPSGSATGSPAPSVSATATATPAPGASAQGGTGGGLAATGTTVLAVGGAGAAAIALGGGLWIAARKRRAA